MRPLYVLVAFGVMCASASANDTSAVLTTGCLEFVTNGNIVMESEDLFISKEEIRVTYRFRNETDTDQSVLVAFPMPDIVPNHFSPVSYPTGPADNAFVSAVRKTLKNPDESWSAPFFESWISYILTTGGNWGQGAIENFRLVIDKGNAANLVSFCGDNVKKIGPTTFEMVTTDYWPQQELNVLILERQADQ